MKLPKIYSSDKKSIHVIIETPYKSRNKFQFDKHSGLFKLNKVIPAGMSFPCDMGFIPHTKGADGDPLDALVLMDELTFPGCLIECRLLGVIKATQKEKGKKEERNDRFILVPSKMPEYNHLQQVSDLNKNKVDSIIDFFINYNKKEEKVFSLLSIENGKEAHSIIKASKTK